MTNKYFVSFVSMIAITSMSFGAIGLAQTVTTLGCSVSVTPVITDQAIVLTAVGGNGTYHWSGYNLDVTNAAGTQFAVSYPNAGTYPITVTSGGQSATCNVSVVAGPSTGILRCLPATQNVLLGQTVSMTASGGNDSYVWSSPDLNIANPTGSGFSANYASVGLKTLTVSSNGSQATCAINVLVDSTVSNSPVTTPGFPNTGGGYGE